MRLFKWGVAEGLLAPSIHAALDVVDGLRRGELGARETNKIRGVENSVIEATLLHLSPIVAAMIKLQRLAGARPAEICVLRPIDVDRAGQVWEYKPSEHKSASGSIMSGPSSSDPLGNEC